MYLSELWHLYEAGKRIQELSLRTLNAYALQNKILMTELGDPEIAEITLTVLEEYLTKQTERLRPSSLGHRNSFCPFPISLCLRRDIPGLKSVIKTKRTQIGQANS